MKFRYLLFFGLLLILINGCKKNTGDSIVDNGGGTTSPIPPPVTSTTIKFSVSNVLQSNMVVQRDKPFVIWGKVSTGTKVNVTVSWNAGPFSATADNNGDWSVTIPAAAANTNAQTITCQVDAANTTTLTNVLIGDVWVCSGQSNMVYYVDLISPFTGVIDYQNEIAAANYPLIRAQTIQNDGQGTPVTSFSFTNPWVVCSPATVGNMSGVAYFFARKLQTTLNVPIGIIVSAINGSYCSDWSNGGSYYNAMINPLIKLPIKGFIWYQGENDSHTSPASNYTTYNNSLIQYWRAVFNQGTLPFYFVQMTPFAEDYYSTTPLGGDPVSDYYAKFREAQAAILATAGTGMAVTMDVGEVPNHHPRNKKPVGERLALLALKNTYLQNVECQGPKYANYVANGATVIVNFVPGTANGLNTINNDALNQFFFVAGADQVFRKAIAVINGNTIVLTAPTGTPLPIQAVRYAFTNAPVTNLQNSAGLPAEPFRTDNW